MSEVLNRTDRTKLRTKMLEVNQAVEKGERMVRAGMDVSDELAKLRELAATYQKLFDEYGT